MHVHERSMLGQLGHGFQVCVGEWLSQAYREMFTRFHDWAGIIRDPYYKHILMAALTYISATLDIWLLDDPTCLCNVNSALWNQSTQQPISLEVLIIDLSRCGAGANELAALLYGGRRRRSTYTKMSF